jgi:hypothetical protein
MPKPMMMTIAVEEIAFGAVFRRLKNMPGVISLDLDGNADEKPAKNGTNGKGKGGGGIAKIPKGSDATGDSAKCIVLSKLAQEKGTPVSGADLTAALVDNGKSPKTFANVSHIMRRDKLARKSKKGWTLTVKGHRYLETECQIGE